MPNSAQLRSSVSTWIRLSASRICALRDVPSVGTLWSAVAIVRSGRRVPRPARRSASNACGLVTSWIRCRSTYSSPWATWCSDQILSSKVIGGIGISVIGLDSCREIRICNLIQDWIHYRTSVYDSGSYTQMFDKALEMIEADAFRERQAAARAEGRYVGLAVSPWVEPSGYGTDIAMQTGFPLASHDNAKVTMDPTGKVF